MTSEDISEEIKSDRSEYLRGWYQKNKERLNEKRRERKKNKIRLSQEIVSTIISKKKRHGYWWEEE